MSTSNSRGDPDRYAYGLRVRGLDDVSELAGVEVAVDGVRASGAAETTLAAGAKASVLIRPERVVLTPAATSARPGAGSPAAGGGLLGWSC